LFSFPYTAFTGLPGNFLLKGASDHAHRNQGEKVGSNSISDGTIKLNLHLIINYSQPSNNIAKQNIHKLQFAIDY